MSTMTEYRQQLALYVLFKSEGCEMTAGEIAEAMGTTSQHVGHPRECWAGVNAQGVVHLMKGLLGDPSVDSGMPKKNTRVGRPEPTWKYLVASRRQFSIPPIPKDFDYKDEPAAGASPQKPKDPYESMSHEQLLAVVRISDEGFGLVHQFFRRLEDFRDSAKKQLRAVGLDPDVG